MLNAVSFSMGTSRIGSQLIHMDSTGRVGGFPYRGRYWAEKRQEIMDNQLIFIVGAFTIVFIAIKNYESVS